MLGGRCKNGAEGFAGHGENPSSNVRVDFGVGLGSTIETLSINRAPSLVILTVYRLARLERRPVYNNVNENFVSRCEIKFSSFEIFQSLKLYIFRSG